MASITGKRHLFFFTSPRSPYKMKDEVRLLVQKFEGETWEGNTGLQAEFFRALASEQFYEDSRGNDLSEKSEEDLALAARDRITRAPKALGIVSLNPIGLTQAGKSYLEGPRPTEAFTRQLMKFQFPSPYHIDKSQFYNVRPYLELLRLINELGSISKDEIAAFVTQLTHITLYEQVKQKIAQFRSEATKLDNSKTTYQQYFDDAFTREIRLMYSRELAGGEFKTRESRDKSLRKFLFTKKNNHRDYADAAIRYMRETQLVTLKSSQSQRLIVPHDKQNEVTFILTNTPRDALTWSNLKDYQRYLFDESVPVLLSDNREALIADIAAVFTGKIAEQDLEVLDLNMLKAKKDQLVAVRRSELIEQQRERIQEYKEFDGILTTYENIEAGYVVDAPTWMEWNTWRAFVMLNDGLIVGNFGVDDAGMPLRNAPGNQADIFCSYSDFELTVEVTLSSGSTQFKMESDSVPRHLSKRREETGRDTYAIFIARKLSPDTITYFYSLHKVKLAGYGGFAKIIPLSLQDLREILVHANRANPKPHAEHIKRFVECACELTLVADDEFDWYKKVQKLAHSWTIVGENCTIG